MAKTSWNDYSATAASNTDIDSVNIDEGCAPSGINNAIRELMAHTADVVAGTTALSSINIDGGSITGITDLAVADGGTGASTASAARTNLGAGTVGGNVFTAATAAAAQQAMDVEVGVDVQAFDADILKADTTDELAVGYTSANSDAGTKSSGTFTPDPRTSNFQHAVNGGAHTLAPPDYNSTMVILYKNNASAGAVTTSGFTKVDGDDLTTTDGDEFFMYITRYNDGSNTFSALTVKALQ